MPIKAPLPGGQHARTKQHLLCKTKPISEALLMNVTSALTSTYEEKPPLKAPKNKANSKPISSPATHRSAAPANPAVRCASQTQYVTVPRLLRLSRRSTLYLHPDPVLSDNPSGRKTPPPKQQPEAPFSPLSQLLSIAGTLRLQTVISLRFPGFIALYYEICARKQLPGALPCRNCLPGKNLFSDLPSQPNRWVQ